MLRISSCLSKIITSKHWHMPKADTATFPELHVTSLQGSKTEYFNVNQLTNLLDIKFMDYHCLCRIHNSPDVVVFVGSSVVVVIVGS